MADFPFQLREGRNAERIRLHLTEILQSPSFVHAHQLRSFLEFLVIGALEGREDEMKEANLGRDVFRRGATYDPRSDAIVRVQASILRKRLAAYYQAEGAQSPIRIALPKGGYVPQVEMRELTEPETGEAIAEESVAPGPPTSSISVLLPDSPLPRRRFVGSLLGFGVGVAAAGAGFAASEVLGQRSREARSPRTTAFDVKRTSPRIWGQLLDPSLPVQLAFGCPQFFNGGGVYVRDVNINDTGGASIPRIREISQQLQRYLTPVPNTYTGVGEMRGIHHLTRFLAYEGIDAGFENVQLLTPEQIQGKTLILVSSHRFRTLLDLLDLPRAYVSNYEESGGFSVSHDDGSHSQVFTSRGSGGAQESYGLVSLWSHPSTKGKILLLSGIDSWATYGATVYITSQGHLAELETKLGSAFSEEGQGVQVLVRMEGHDNQLSSVSYHSHRVL